MTKSDPALLELFAETGIAMPPAVVAYNIDGVSRSTVKRRLSVLTANSLLEKVDDNRGYYRISDRGRAYLEGELEAADLEQDD